MGQGYWKLNNKIVLEEIFMVEFLATDDPFNNFL